MKAPIAADTTYSNSTLTRRKLLQTSMIAVAGLAAGALPALGAELRLGANEKLPVVNPFFMLSGATNAYIPFNFRRTRYQWEACREDSPSPEETWRRVGEAESRRQKEKADRIEKEQIDARRRVFERQRVREERAEQSEVRSLERLGVCAELERLSPLPRLERICTDQSHPLDFYPKGFADMNGGESLSSGQRQRPEEVMRRPAA